MNNELWGNISWPVDKKKVNTELKVEYPYDVIPSNNFEDLLARSQAKSMDEILTKWINNHGYSARDIAFGHISITGITHPDQQIMYVMEARGRKLSALVLRFSDLRREEKDHSITYNMDITPEEITPDAEGRIMVPMSGGRVYEV